MEPYQIHIARNGQKPMTHACMLASDYAAIRRARSMAKDCAHVEVWRGSHCVFAGRSVECGP